MLIATTVDDGVQTGVRSEETGIGKSCGDFGYGVGAGNNGTTKSRVGCGATTQIGLGEFCEAATSVAKVP